MKFLKVRITSNAYKCLCSCVSDRQSHMYICMYVTHIRYHDYQLMLFSLLLLLLLLKLFPKKKKKNFLWATSKTTNNFNKKKNQNFCIENITTSFSFHKGKRENGRKIAIKKQTQQLNHCVANILFQQEFLSLSKAIIYTNAMQSEIEREREKVKPQKIPLDNKHKHIRI